MANDIEIDDRAFLAALGPAMAGIRGQAIRKIDDTAKDIETRAQRHAPKKTHRLAESIRADDHGIHLDADTYEITVGTRLYYATWVEYGTDEHPIKVKNAQVLTDGESFFGRAVVHPGTIEQPFMRPAIVEAVAEWGHG
jgi:hypothetical protein